MDNNSLYRIRKGVQAEFRLMVKKTLGIWLSAGKREKATLRVLEQAKLLGYEWVKV